VAKSSLVFMQEHHLEYQSWQTSTLWIDSPIASSVHEYFMSSAEDGWEWSRNEARVGVV